MMNQSRSQRKRSGIGVVVGVSVAAIVLLQASTVLSFAPLPIIQRGLPRGTTARRFSHVSLKATIDASEVFVAKKRQQDNARGAALLLEDVSISRGPSQILSEINWRIEPKTKWGLIGPNGSGKSTLLKAIVGEILYEGDIFVGGSSKDNDIGYLRQTAVSGSNRTILDEAASAMMEVQHAKRALEMAQENLASAGDNSNNEELLQVLDRAIRRFEAVGGYTQEKKVASMLKGLGFNDIHKNCNELSGGWQMRVAFAKILLSDKKLVLMDEPGNHLDQAARTWLANYLATYDGDSTLVLVTHDVQLLKSIENIAEVTPTGTLQIYKSCTYQQYLELKEQRAISAMSEFEKNQKKAEKLQGFVDRFGASATKASAAQSRVKQLEKMQKEGLLDEPDAALMVERFKPTLRLPNPPRAIGDTLLSLRNANIGYEKPLVSNVNLKIMRGMKLLVRGPNGAGKSTLLHSLKGTLPLMEGDRIENESLRLGVFTQDLAQELDVTVRAVDAVTAYARNDYDITISDQSARTVMGALGLQGEKSLRKIGDLSGGEKARVALSMFALKPSNLYLLDEVSNHLDIECLEALSESLSEWGSDEGAIVVISHDRTFCEKIEFTHVATISDGKLTLEQRSTTANDWKVIKTTLDGADSDSDSTTSAQSRKEEDPELRKKLFNAPKRISKLESMIEKAEEKIATLDEEMLANGSDVGKLVDLTKEKNELESQISEYMEEWEELELLLSSQS